MGKHRIRSFKIRISSILAPREKADCVVIGAGVVGVALARELALKGREVLVVDSASKFGANTSSCNSQVIHAGIYYLPNSLKALFCVRGRKLLYSYCPEHGILYKHMGKLIVATSPAEIPNLYQLMNRAAQNGVDGLRMLEGFEAMKMKPQLQCLKALFSPVSGTVDVHSLMLSLMYLEGYEAILIQIFACCGEFEFWVLSRSEGS
ncbi:hypothetical protein MANES_07G109500v8 [Manihot esculenta]|uniref:Uncharacterized protein n=1 Tax=Manihot esculenta TaxID=3983 RepID=A0ACB7HEV2_MANES|nr:hypothetical protein MANES_07G109500v8 [Manihot esculenta]